MYTLYVIQDVSSHVDLILYVISLDDALQYTTATYEYIAFIA